MTHGFYVVSVWVSDERGKVVRVIVGPHLGLVEDLCLVTYRCGEERVNRLPVIGGERDVSFSKPLSGSSRTEPEHGVITAEANSVCGINKATTTQGRQHRVVEGRAGIGVTALKGDVIKHDVIGAHGADAAVEAYDAEDVPAPAERVAA